MGIFIFLILTTLVFINAGTPGTPGTPLGGQQQVVKKLSDTSIAITASGVKVTLRERYSLFAAAEMDTCVDRDALQPLIRFECTTVTLLLLQHPAQVSPATKAIHNAALRSAALDTRQDKREACARLFQTLISNPEQVCHRAVSIEPYL